MGICPSFVRFVFINMGPNGSKNVQNATPPSLKSFLIFVFKLLLNLFSVVLTKVLICMFDMRLMIYHEFFFFFVNMGANTSKHY